MQIYEFLSKSQQILRINCHHNDVCLYANIRIFKQITTIGRSEEKGSVDVCLYANIRIFKQITTH